MSETDPDPFEGLPIDPERLRFDQGGPDYLSYLAVRVGNVIAERRDAVRDLLDAGETEAAAAVPSWSHEATLLGIMTDLFNTTPPVPSGRVVDILAAATRMAEAADQERLELLDQASPYPPQYPRPGWRSPAKRYTVRTPGSSAKVMISVEVPPPYREIIRGPSAGPRPPERRAPPDAHNERGVASARSHRRAQGIWGRGDPVLGRQGGENARSSHRRARQSNGHGDAPDLAPARLPASRALGHLAREYDAPERSGGAGSAAPRGAALPAATGVVWMTNVRRAVPSAVLSSAQSLTSTLFATVIVVLSQTAISTSESMPAGSPVAVSISMSTSSLTVLTIPPCRPPGRGSWSSLVASAAVVPSGGVLAFDGESAVDLFAAFVAPLGDTEASTGHDLGTDGVAAGFLRDRDLERQVVGNAFECGRGVHRDLRLVLLTHPRRCRHRAAGHARPGRRVRRLDHRRLVLDAHRVQHPYGVFTDQGEAIRDDLNHWILTSGEYDAVVDFAGVLADPADPDRLRPEYDGTDARRDAVHLNDAGFAAMTAAIDLDQL